MRTIIITLTIFAICTSCASYYERVIESDYSFSGNFNKYDSFDFMVNSNPGVAGDQQVLVEKFIGQRLNTLGYSYSEKRPSIIVSYKVFYDDFQMKGYMQPNFTSWVEAKQGNVQTIDKKKKDIDEDEESEEYSDYYTVTDDGTYVDREDEGYDDLKCEMKDGSLLISFFDRRAKRTVWQGYASGVVSKMNEERFLRHTVGKILDEYTVLAQGFGMPN